MSYFQAISNSSAEGDVRFLGGQGSAREYVCAEPAIDGLSSLVLRRSSSDSSILINRETTTTPGRLDCVWAQQCFSRQDQTSVSVNSVLIEWVAQMNMAQQSGIFPVVVASTRPDLNSISQMVFGNQQHRLDREVVRSEACFAVIEVSAVSDFVDLVTCPDNLESFITAVAVASPMLYQGAHPVVRARDSIDRTADPSRIYRRKRNNDFFIFGVTFGVTTVPKAIEGNMDSVYLWKTSSEGSANRTPVSSRVRIIRCTSATMREKDSGPISCSISQ